MKLLRITHKVELTPNMTPMIDIVFQLIIFFMVVMTIVSVEVTDIAVPEAEQGQRLDRRELDVIVNIRREGDIIVTGRSVAPVQVADIVRQSLDEAGTGGIRVHIRGDENAPFKPVRDVMKACAEAGVRDIFFAVTPQETGGGRAR